MVVHIHRDKTLLAHMGKKKTLVRILSMTDTGAVTQYELVDEPGNKYMPLIVDGKNVEEFEILGEQLNLFQEG
ncbi:hypothetical protein [Tissierella sp.]|uniref:hypothetical protein n=1 Tax=Tissierella sp. TaxID=41274 RepID=UPI003061DE70